MGKNKNKGKKQQQQKVVKGAAAANRVSLPTSSSIKPTPGGPFPLSYPSQFQYPKGSFLRNEEPYQESFQQAVDTSYEGFVVDNPEVLKNEQVVVEDALQVLEGAGFFRVDVTQPFGLGTKCAKTYVTRCLVGAPGTTYKYLGLRMFAHSWNKTTASAASPVKKALATIGSLNDTLTQRTEHHLVQLNQKRQHRGAAPTRGRVGFDIALINRMESTNGLKPEPSMGEGKCSVSWHADSSLEHFSTISVYHLVSNDVEGQWSVGLRVAHNSEGPQASRRGTDISIIDDTPPISVSLPTGSTYYLLEDFNHHHQHTVIAEGKVPGRRFSSTHRLLRDSHNVDHILARCKTACAGFHKKGAKLWRSEQLLLTELESEWLRQFFIQGKAHYDLLWANNWGEPMQELLKYWSQLEERTKQTVDWLQHGAEGKCGLDVSNSTTADGPPPPRSERKLREKRKKAREGVEDLLKRTAESSNGAHATLYEPMAVLLEERTKMRDLWQQREQDGVFHEVDRDNRPMPIPFDFLVSSGKRPNDRGWSPMAGFPTEMRALAMDLRSWGSAYESGDIRELPVVVPTVAKSSPNASDNHTKPLDWTGWKLHEFGLEMQHPWAGQLLTGKKSIETRAYNLPANLIGKKVEILQSSQGKAGISALGDTFGFSAGLVERVGWCLFEQVLEYRDQAAFEADEGRHMVKRDSGYGWKAGSTEVVYGWVVSDFGLYDQPEVTHNGAIRRMRSLFELQPIVEDEKRKAEAPPSSQGRRNRKKRRKKH
jgi:alpha-ketoglutarate-dependent dioxygenase FTO